MEYQIRPIPYSDRVKVLSIICDLSLLLTLALPAYEGLSAILVPKSAL